MPRQRPQACCFPQEVIAAYLACNIYVVACFYAELSRTNSSAEWLRVLASPPIWPVAECPRRSTTAAEDNARALSKSEPETKRKRSHVKGSGGVVRQKRIKRFIPNYCLHYRTHFLSRRHIDGDLTGPKRMVFCFDSDMYALYCYSQSYCTNNLFASCPTTDSVDRIPRGARALKCVDIF